jgi:triosephosphate isomerase
MNNNCAQSVELVRQLMELVSKSSGVDIVVAPPYTALRSVATVLKGSSIGLAAQNIFWEETGAFTGEIGPAMLTDVGCTHVIIGHSERRQYFNETDETVNKRIKAALKTSLISIVCIGETLAEREDEKTLSVIERQVTEGLRGVVPDEMERVIIAYEPVWAIGTGKTATPEQAQEVHHFIRELIAKIYSKRISEQVRILYGGSVKPANSNSLMEQEDIDGALVGGASLKADSFAGIINFKK